MENLALACPRCNARKWKHVEASESESAQPAPLFNPRLHVWTDHFRWSANDSAVIEPISAIGRANLVLLDLNSSQHVTIRALLRILHLHPPGEKANPDAPA